MSRSSPHLKSRLFMITSPIVYWGRINYFNGIILLEWKINAENKAHSSEPVEELNWLKGIEGDVLVSNGKIILFRCNNRLINQ